MNRRISKKQHKKYLPDFSIEICQDKQWLSRLSKIELGESLTIETTSNPKSFYSRNRSASLCKLNFKVTRVKLSSVPSTESSWWQIDGKTIFLAFRPAEFKSRCWYAAINFRL
jgi:hypothetical protein